MFTFGENKKTTFFSFILGNFALKIVEFFYRKKALFFLCLILSTVFISIGISRLQINESIFSTLPKGKSFEQLDNLVKNKSISNQVVFSIDFNDSTGDQDASAIANTFADSLKRVSKNYLADVVASRPDVSDHVYAYFYSQFPYLIDTSYYRILRNKSATDSIHMEILHAYDELVSPGSSFLKKYVLNDPLGLTGDFFKNIQSYSNSEGIVVDDGIVFSKNKKQILITSKTLFSTDDSKENVALHILMETFKTAWNQAHPENQMDFFGTFEIAAGNAMQVRKDLQHTVFLALALIIFILFFYYRKLLIPFYFVLPAIFGGAFALGVMGFIKPQVSVISLATSAILLGIIVDYSFHFFTHLRHAGSVSMAVKEIGAPLFTGSFTTIAALAALRYCNSVVLQDFGMIGALSLLGAAVFTLIGLPVLLKIVSFDYKNIPEEYSILRVPPVPMRFRKWYILLIIALTGFFLYTSRYVQFDSDLNNLSFHSDKLKKKEEELTGINPAVEKKLYVFAADENLENASHSDFILFEKLKQLQQHGVIKSFVSPAQFFIPIDIKEEREERWRNFWDSRRSTTLGAIAETADSIGFNTTAFSGFQELIGENKMESEMQGKDSLIRILGLNNLIETTDRGTTFINTVVVNNANLEAVKSEMRKIEGVEIFDRGEIASSLLDLVKGDFNYILYITASIVFLTLLVVYGRIELTLLAFFPMAISWIWILGIAGLFDIKFNFVNVVISTFVFGLGDDFSIFVTDGLLNKYKYGKDSLASYTSAILLSALTTFIGIGVLFFAVHPAIHSVSIISMIGIACILFLSLTLQPILFDFFVQKRIEKKKAPIPFTEFIVSVLEFTYFTWVCTSFYLVLLVFLFLPFSRKRKAILMNRFISFFAWTVIYFDLQVKKRIFNRQNLDLEKPSIIIANHSSFLDILLMIMMNRRIVMMVKDWVYHSPLFGIFLRYAGYVYSETGSEKNLENVSKLVANGYSLLIFPEGTRSPDGKMQRFHKGAFYLSKELNLDITPILIHGASYVLPKNDYLVKSGDLNLKILPRIKSDDLSWGETYQERAKNISRYFKIEHERFSDERETAALLGKRVYKNFIFKGPVVEWYLKVKWKLESKHYEHYNELIGERKRILDAGCGYGYLSLYLHYKDADRKITGLDYDEEKIAIAKNCFDKNENMQFELADITTCEIEKQDVIFLNDVLHYFTKKNQETVLNKCVAALNNNGLLFIREGITNLGKKHSATRLTEFLSTRIFRFNKKVTEFNFIASDDIIAFAEKNSMSVEMKDHSANTSNVLFVLKKSN